MGVNPTISFDSVILIDALKDINNAAQKLMDHPYRAISVIVRTEVLAGVTSEAEAILAEAILKSCENIPVSEDIATLAAQLRQRYRLKTADAIIYATARAMNIPLVTRDLAFPDLNDVKFL
jgi:predicted nucleic acid-binding protein